MIGFGNDGRLDGDYERGIEPFKSLQLDGRFRYVTQPALADILHCYGGAHGEGFSGQDDRLFR